jgi:energy-coupling factor transporter ATP-binding protein EcfA2
MLKKIRIKNFRLCVDTLVDDVGKVAVLVGRNGAGKSNILQAIVAASRSATTAADMLRTFSPHEKVEISLEFELPTGSYRYTVSSEVKPNRQKFVLGETLDRQEPQGWINYIARAAEEVQIAGGPSLKIGEASPCLSAIATLLPAADPVSVEVKPIISFLSAIHYYGLDEPATSQSAPEFKLIGKNDYAKWLSEYQSSGVAGDSVDSVLLRILDMFLRAPDNFEALQGFLGRNALGLVDKIRVVDYGSMGKPPSPEQRGVETYYGVWFEPCRGSRAHPVLVPYSALSVGTRRIIRMFTVMLFDASTVMLLEQPEDSLNQGMTKKVISLLRENVDSQLIMTSHSSALLNKLRPEDIQLVSLHDGYTVARKLTSKERENATNFMNDEGPLYDFVSSLPEEE